MQHVFIQIMWLDTDHMLKGEMGSEVKEVISTDSLCFPHVTGCFFYQAATCIYIQTT